MPNNYMSDYKTAAIKAENKPLYLLARQHHISIERILYLIDMDTKQRIAVLDEPMQPLIASDDPADSDVYCPSCHNTVSGGWLEEHPENRPVYQCPHCGQAINPFKTTKPKQTLHDFWSNSVYEGTIIDFFDKNGKPVDDLDYPDETEILKIISPKPDTYHVTLNV